MAYGIKNYNLQILSIQINTNNFMVKKTRLLKSSVFSYNVLLCCQTYLISVENVSVNERKESNKKQQRVRIRKTEKLLDIRESNTTDTETIVIDYRFSFFYR